MKRGVQVMVVFLSVMYSLSIAQPLADGQDKFLGCAWSPNQNVGFTTYWNQVTPENGGKWGFVEPIRDQMNWNEMTAAYNLAKNNGFLFKNHTMIWGNQAPSWIETLDDSTQLEELKEWFAATAAGFPDMEFIDVVNEPLHAPPSSIGKGNYSKALGGNGTTGWDWVIESFRLARQYFPDSKLLINEYGIINSQSETNRYINIIELLMADSLIDGIGIQCHAFNTAFATVATMKANLDLLAATGLPIYVSELDIDGPDDITQLKEYQRVFPVFWEHPAVAGVTLWGFRVNLWRHDQKAYLVNSTGSDRPAFTWLKAYVKGTYVESDSVSVSSATDTIFVGESLQMVANISPDTATIKRVNWSVNNRDIANIGTNGILNSITAGKVIITARTWDNGNAGSKEIVIINRLVDSIHITSSNDIDSIDLNETLSFQAAVYPENATNATITWKTAPAGLATITANGVLTPVAEGMVSVIAMAQDGSHVTDTLQIVIINRLVDSINITSSNDIDSIDLDETLSFQAAVYPENATNTSITWKTVPAGLATITANGVLTPLAEGIVKVVALAQDGSAVTDTFEVTIINPTSVPAFDAGLISVYPNPAPGGLFTISVPDNVTAVTIADLYGRIIRRFNDLRSPIRVDLNNYKGIMVIHFSDGKNTISRKVVVE